MSAPDPEFPMPAPSAGAHPSAPSLMRTAGFAILAGFAAWGIGEVVHDLFSPELTLAQSLSGEQLELEHAADLKRSMILYGALAGFLGLTMGLAGCLKRSMARPALIAGLTGLTVGAAAGALISLVLVPVHQRSYDPDSEDLIMPLLIHAAIWAAAGLAAGLALTLAAGPRHRLPGAILGGIAGAILAAGIYEIVGGLAFPLGQTVEPIARTSGARLLACLVVAIGAATGAHAGLEPPRARTTKVIPG